MRAHWCQGHKTRYFRNKDIFPYFSILFYGDVVFRIPFYKNTEKMSLVQKYEIFIALAPILAK